MQKLGWMDNIAKEASIDKSKSQMILTWRQNDSFVKAKSLYGLVDNRLIFEVKRQSGP